MNKQNLVVVSKIKEYVKTKADLNTSDAVATKLTEQIEKLLDNAIEKAKKDKRKTVLDRDVAVFDVAH